MLSPLFYTVFLTEIVNGEKNLLVINVENKSDKNVTLLNIAGSVNKPDSGALIRNVSAVSSTPLCQSFCEGVGLRGRSLLPSEEGMKRIRERKTWEGDAC